MSELKDKSRFLTWRFFALAFCIFSAIGSCVLAFPQIEHNFSDNYYVQSIGVVICLIFVWIAIRALLRRNFLSSIFHVAMVLLFIGMCVSDFTISGLLPLADGDKDDAIYDEKTMMSFVENLKFTVEMKNFVVEKYPSGMPKQYISNLLVDGKPAQVWVNKPFRYQGWTFYQMSYGNGRDLRTGKTITYSILKVKKDYSVPFIYTAYALLVLAALGLIKREFPSHTAMTSKTGIQGKSTVSGRTDNV